MFDVEEPGRLRVAVRRLSPGLKKISTFMKNRIANISRTGRSGGSAVALLFVVSVFLRVSSKSVGSDILDRPNVILIVTDDQGYGDMSCHGNPWLRTPNLDRLATESVQLEDYHVDPVCTPSRAALLTGRYCTRVGAWAVTEGRQWLDPREVTMADVFRESGYRTGMFGKWHLGDAFPFSPQDRGFQDVLCHREGGVDEIGNPVGNDFFDDIYFRNGTPEKVTGYCTDVWFQEATRFIEEKDERPFFVYLPTNAMHSPFRVAEKYSKRFTEQGLVEDRAKFLGMIENFDENLGRLLETLQLLAIEKNTIIIVMGDNGTAEGATGLPAREDGFNAGMRGKKGSVYEGGHRVACFVRWPDRFAPGLKVKQLTCHRDWLPTLMEICNLRSAREIRFDGQSMAMLLRDEKVQWPDRTMFVERQSDHIQPAELDKKPSAVTMAVLTEQWRMLGNELYDITRDSSQTQDVARQFPDVVERLYSAYRRHYDDVMSHEGKPVSIPAGIEQHSTTNFTVRDWHPTQGAVIW
jgi:uncharacterized sulfatase